MVLEVAILTIKPGLNRTFEADFGNAEKIIMLMNGYIKHQLKKCLENSNQYILLVEWETVEDHEEGFRKSEEYGEWKRLLHHYYEPFPIVEHYVDF